ncbi:hypothetical protein S726_004084 [Salmonella enterica subsp. enterica]|nr:hypothetical protein [Salmonella enterica subsp. enterica]
MSNKKKIFAMIFAFLGIQVCILLGLKNHSSKNISLECSSTTTRNFKTNHDLFFSAYFSALFKNDGTGSVSIVGKTSESVPRKFSHAYYFSYELDGEGRVTAKITKATEGIDNQIEDETFRRDIIDVTPRSKGGIKISQFENVYIFSMPDIIVNTCAPLRDDDDG